jgi:hypothetical protein
MTEQTTEKLDFSTHTTFSLEAAAAAGGCLGFRGRFWLGGSSSFSSDTLKMRLMTSLSSTCRSSSLT